LRLLFDPEPSDKEKQLALKFFENKCAYCGESGPKLHFDHAVASSQRYGHNHISNRVPACSKCNAHHKREIPWRDFLDLKFKDDPSRIPELALKIELWF